MHIDSWARHALDNDPREVRPILVESKTCGTNSLDILNCVPYLGTYLGKFTI
jgi:hypothetical protein